MAIHHIIMELILEETAVLVEVAQEVLQELVD